MYTTSLSPRDWPYTRTILRLVKPARSTGKNTVRIPRRREEGYLDTVAAKCQRQREVWNCVDAISKFRESLGERSRQRDRAERSRVECYVECYVECNVECNVDTGTGQSRSVRGKV